MKILLLISVLGILVGISTAGPTGSPEQAPIKFLVLQRSDILGDDSALPTDPAVTESEVQEDAPVTEPTVEVTTDSYVEDEVPEAVVKESSKKLWNPVEGWRELNFPVVPEGDGVFETVTRVRPVESESNKTVPFFEISENRIACVCGNATGKIVGGDEARINDVPWTAALVRNGFFGFGASKKPYCGGTLINNLYIATASHCVDGMFAGGLKVWLNEENYLIDSETSGRQEYLVDEIIMHSDYDRRNVNNDIALLKLAKPVPLGPSSFIAPVCLPANNDVDFAGITATVAGWGLTSDGGPQSNALRKVDVPIMSNEFCNSDKTKYKGKISENMMCAGYADGGKDSCQGDSGGPLIIDNNGRKTLVGIVSWGFGCAQPNAPGVYTRVARYPAWILDNTKDAQWCSE